jgi:hypothetical protein
MSKSFRASTRLALAGAVAVLGAGGIVAGVATAAASPRAAAPPPVDHQLCYTASSTAFKIPAGVRLFNQFSPKGFAPHIAPKPVLHCNPVVKILPTGQTFPITNPNAHLVCFPITPPAAQPTPAVSVTNQFGTATLIPSQPNLLCVPSWKSLTGPPGKTPRTPPGLNHFTCYPVKLAPGSNPYNPPPVMLQDEFARQPVKAQVSRVPDELCLPTKKVLASGKIFKIINPALHLLCFPVTPTPIISPVFDENQFGTRKVAISQTRWLCVPSTKKLVG